MAPDGSGVENELMREFAHTLDHARKLARRLVLTRAVGLFLSMVIPAFLLLVALDWLWRFPTGIRHLFLVAWLFLFCLLFLKILFPIRNFDPSRVSIAHRLERSHPSLRGRCVPIVGLGETDHMAPEAMEEVGHLISGSHVRRAMKMGPSSGWLVLGLGFLISTIMVSVILPSTMSTGSTRLFLPWIDARWPARTAVESLMNLSSESVHGRGIPMLLRARNKTPGAPSGEVWVSYRVLGSEDDQWRTELLTDQGEGIHERVVSTTGSRIEFSFHTEDAVTDQQSCELLQLPEITSAHLDTTPPSHLSSRIASRSMDMRHDGRFENTTDSSILEGSRVKLELTTNRPIPYPEPSKIQEWMTDILGWSGDPRPDIVFNEIDPGSFVVQWTMGDPVRLVVQPRDSHGLRARSPWVVSLDSHPDRLPTVAIVNPPGDLSVLPTATIPLSSTGSDDIGLSTLGFELHPDTPALHPGSASSTWQHSITVEGTSGSLEHELDLGALEPGIGTILYLHATATDLHRDEHGTGRILHSSPRRIQVVDDTTFMSMLRQRLTLLEQRIRQLDERQAALQRLVRTGSWTREDRREQASISRSINEQESILDGIWTELEMNRASDERMESLLTISGDSIDRAASSSHAATIAMESDSDPAPVLQEQETVRFELQELVAILSEDEESWVVIQRLEHLMEAQADLQGRTAAAGEDILGLSRNELPEDQVDAIDDLAGEQLSLIENAASLLEALQRQAGTLAGMGDDESDSMERALDIVEDSKLAEEIQNATRAITEARIESAVQSQQQVLDALNAARSAMESSTEGGVRELARRFEEMKKAVERLVSFQRNELLSLDSLLAGSPVDDLDISMIRLRTNTLSVADDMRRTGPQARPAASALDMAAGAQGSAVLSLRSEPFDGEGARVHEERSLDHLESVLSSLASMAEEARSQAEARERKDLSSRYKALAEREVDLYRSTIDLEGVVVDRRVRFDLRKLSRIQEEIRLELAEILSTTPQLEDAVIFTHAHQLIDELGTGVRDTLASGTVDTTTLLQEQSIIRHLKGLAESLRQSTDEPGFSSSRSTSGASSSQGGGERPLVPPVAELQLLRSMQEGILLNTEQVNSTPNLETTGRAELLEHLAFQQDALAGLGIDMLRKLQEADQGTIDVQQPDSPTMPPPGWLPFESPIPSEPLVEDEEWPDLDNLLDLQPEGEEERFEDIPPTASGDEEQTPLHSAIDCMRRAAQRLDAGEGGLETQRVQKEVIAHLDALLEMASRQRESAQGQGSSDSSQASDPSSSSETQQVGSDDSSPGAGQNPGEAFPPPAREEMLGGTIEELGSEWGMLPERVREMLHQGRRERYSVIYERMTAEYYRKLAEEAGRE